MVHRHHHATRVLPLTNHFESVPNSEFFFKKKKIESITTKKKIKYKKKCTRFEIGGPASSLSASSGCADK